VNRAAAWAFHQVLVEQFIAVARSELILDFDATEDQVHGNQRVAPITVTTTLGVFCRSMFFAASNCLFVFASQQD
jgi:hypothetical protein